MKKIIFYMSLFLFLNFCILNTTAASLELNCPKDTLGVNETLNCDLFLNPDDSSVKSYSFEIGNNVLEFDYTNIELEYDEYLTGKSGAIKYYSDGKGNKLEIPDSYVAPTKGMTLKLTFDLKLVEAVDNELSNVTSTIDRSERHEGL